MRFYVLLTMAACGTSPPAIEHKTAGGGSSNSLAVSTAGSAGPTAIPVGCDVSITAACARVQADVAKRPGYTWVTPGIAQASTTLAALSRCADPMTAGAKRVGAWRYALVAPLYTNTETIAATELAAMLAPPPAAPPPDPKAKRSAPAAPVIEVRASAETKAALALSESVAVVDGRPEIDATHWAIVPAHELLPAWKVITVDGAHPLAGDGAPALTVPLCAPAALDKLAVTNVDPEKLTVIAMTGTTAPTRYLARLMDAKGTTYPAKDVLPWFTGVDYVHISNEVSFTKACTNPTAATADLSFCARESYIELLEAVHAQIIELTGSHLTDYGREPFRNTMAMYAARGWKTFGGGHDQNEGTKPLELEHHGNKIAFVGCNMLKTTEHTIWNGYADVAVCDLPRLEWQMADLVHRGFTPIISIQHEEVYVHDPPDAIVRDFRRLADSGAAVIFGSQAHCAHPFEVHHGAFLHYGAGNFFFDQDATNTRDGVADRLFFYEGKLLTVGHLYTRIEENGRPRPLTDRERAGLLRDLTTSLKRLSKGDPWAAATPAPLARYHPDSFLVKNRSQRVLVFPPTTATDKAALAIVVKATTSEDELGTAVEPSAKADAFVIAPFVGRGGTASKELLEAIKKYAIAKFAIDPEKITIVK